ncbi:hypothetical protein [Paenibacillus flagellatus]|uniref:Hydrolase n=1 Tax=Paenibacillus flagellatus TaxID=2211139 RepID=A0A2V5KSG9_9BACL|nr:hypothetical protein [Paenibacillus flagellatus]PYI54587.1 hypothetical protein DLM86_14095 [Paenibacillus flagellatus]
MEKKTYYVSVQAGTVLENEGDAAYEFEIQATEAELDDLVESFELLSDLDNDSAARALNPFEDYSQDEENDNYDITLTQIYRKLYDMGTEQTRRTIAGMGMIGEQEKPIAP